jgi:hypothetical protein
MATSSIGFLRFFFLKKKGRAKSLYKVGRAVFFAAHFHPGFSIGPDEAHAHPSRPKTSQVVMSGFSFDP